MRIIKQGEVKEYEVTCNECGTVFAFRRSEARTDIVGMDYTAVRVECPLCSATVHHIINRENSND